MTTSVDMLLLFAPLNISAVNPPGTQLMETEDDILMVLEDGATEMITE